MQSNQANIGVLEYDEITKKYRYYVKAPKIKNLVISGGGAKGVILPGVIRAFENFFPDGEDKPSFMEQIECIPGSSVGAITAALLASGIRSNELINEANSTHGKEILGEGDFFNLVNLDGIPLTNFIRKNMWKSIENRLYQKYGTKDKYLLIDQLTEINNTHNEVLQPLLNYLRTDVMGEIPFNMLDCLHGIAPEYFKHLIITGTEISSGKTFYFCNKTTPHLDIIKAARASAALPIVLTPVTISVEELKGGSLEQHHLIPDTGFLTFIDGGYFDNIPASILKNPDSQELDLETLVLVFDEAMPVLGQSQMLNVRNPGPVYSPRKRDSVIRDYLPRFLSSIQTDEKNTLAKQKKLEEIRILYTQRNIPLAMDITTTDFEKASENATAYQTQGERVTKAYLINHQDELICYFEADNLHELKEKIPVELKQDFYNQAEQFGHMPQNISTTAYLIENICSPDSPTKNLNHAITESIMKFFNVPMGSDYVDISDKLKRTYIQELKNDLYDNLENNLNNKQKHLNILRILMTHLHHAVIANNTSYRDALLLIMSKQFNEEVMHIGLTLKPENSLKNMDLILQALYPEKFTHFVPDIYYANFLESLHDIVIINQAFWEGKGVSKGIRTHKIPRSVEQIATILKDEKMSNEQKYYAIQHQIFIAQHKDVPTRHEHTHKLQLAISHYANFGSYICKRDFLRGYMNKYIYKANINNTNDNSQSKCVYRC